VDGVRQISNNFGVQVWEMRQFFPFIAVAPQCREGWAAGSTDTYAAIQILDNVIALCGGDPARVFLTGVSSGGDGVWAIGSAFADRFAGIVPLCGESGAKANKLAGARVPVWQFYNNLDTSNIVAFNRITQSQLIERGESPQVTGYHDLGHDCWNRAYRTTALYRWMLSQNRNHNIGSPTFRCWKAAELAREWDRRGPGRWEAWTGSRRSGRQIDDVVSSTTAEVSDEIRGKRGGQLHAGEGAPFDDLTHELVVRREDPSWLVSNVSGVGIEFHGDVWLDRAKECEVALVADSGEMFLASIVAFSEGTGGIVDGTGSWLSRLDPSSQRALHVDGWNDVRVCLFEGRLKLTLNGWLAAEIVPAPTGVTSWRCALVAPRDGSEVSWRFVRTRVLDR
jgi:hypothetical protein